MQLARFSLNDQIQWGIVEGDEIRSIEGDLYDNPRAGSRLCALSDARLLAPIDAHGQQGRGNRGELRRQGGTRRPRASS